MQLSNKLPSTADTLFSRNAAWNELTARSPAEIQATQLLLACAFHILLGELVSSLCRIIGYNSAQWRIQGATQAVHAPPPKAPRKTFFTYSMQLN
jgi:hypothetical protein